MVTLDHNYFIVNNIRIWSIIFSAVGMCVLLVGLSLSQAAHQADWCVLWAIKYVWEFHCNFSVQ